MAVEIPVYVDIKGAFDRAVSEIPKELPKLEKVLSSKALSMNIDFGRGATSLRNVLTDTTLSAKDLEKALRAIKREYDAAVVSGASKSRTSAEVNNLAKAYGLVEQRLKGVYNANTVAAMRLEDTIAKVKFKIKELQGQLSSLAPGTDQFNKLNYQLILQQRRLGDLTKQVYMYKAGIDQVSNSLGKQTGLVKQLTGYFSGLYAVHLVARFVKQIRDVTGELEYQRVALGHLLKDEAAGNELFARTMEAAKESPFRIMNLVTYTKQLAAYRIEQERLFDTTQRLADISAGLGVDMNRLILAYGQVRAASVLRGQELRQFTEAGIPLVEELADKFTELKGKVVSTADVFKLISDRAVPFSMISEIFEDLTDKGGMFYEMQKQQAETLKGRWEKLKDAYDQALQRVGESSTFQGWNDTVLKALTLILNNLQGIVRVLNAATVSFVAYRVVTKAVSSDGFKLARVFARDYGAAGLLTVAVNGLTAAWKRLSVAFKANWVGLAISVVAGLITYLTTFRKKTEEATNANEAMERSIEEMAKANDDYRKTKNMIDRYEKLSSKIELTAKENLRLAKTMSSLREEFPALIDEIGNENEALSEQVAHLTKANEERLKERRAAKEKELNIEEEKNKALEREAEEATKQYSEAYKVLIRAQALRDKGAKELNKDLIGTPTVGYTDAKLQADVERAAAASSAAMDVMDEANKKLETSNNLIARLKEQIEPSDTKKEWQEWQNQISALQNKLMSLGDTPVFTPEEIGNFTSIYDLSQKLKKKIDDLTVSVKGMKMQFSDMSNKSSAAAEALSSEISASEKTLEIAEAIRLSLGLIFKKSSGSDTRLSDLKKDMGEITNAYKKFLDLQEYMGRQSAIDEIGVLFPQLNGWIPTLESTLEKLKRMRDDVSAKLAKSPKDKTLLEMQRAIDTEISNLKFDDLKKTIDANLKKISEDIKHSETARNFYNDILSLSGDETLSATLTMSVYGETGKKFKDRIQKELYESISSIDKSKVDNGVIQQMLADVTTLDWDDLEANLDKVPKEVQDLIKRLRADTEKYESEQIKSYASLLLKFDEIEQQKVNIKNQSRADIAAVEEGLEKEISGIKANAEIKDKEAAEAAARARAALVVKGIEDETKLSLSRLEKDYRLFFGTVGLISDEAARKVVADQKEMLYKQFLQDGNFVKYNREIRALNDQLEKYTKNKGLFAEYLSGGFDSAAEKLSQYSDNLRALAGTLTDKDGKIDVSEESIDFVNKLGLIFGGKAFGVSGRKNVWNQLVEKFEGQPEEIKKAFSDAASELDSKLQNFQAGIGWADFWVSLIGGAINTFDEIAQHSKNASGEVQEGWNEVANVIMKIPTLGLSKTDDAWERFTSMNDRAMEGFEKFKSGNILGALVDVVYSWAEMFEKSTRTIDRQIEEQSETIEDLDYQYKRLENSIQKAFGSDYIANYNKQLDALYAKQEAYMTQANLESQKGKKADPAKIKEYEDAARDVGDQILDMQSQLSEFFSGTDLTSAAKDFANAWIEAYKEFGSTTDAMREKFNDMLQNMVENSLAAKIMQEILAPLFQQIDDMAADSELSGADIAQIAASAPEYIDKINAAMSSLMAGLTAAGYNIRQQPGQFTGIKRNLANATEESINGLTQQMLVNNVYMSHIPVISANVAQILAIMSGGTAENPTTGASYQLNNELALQYMSALPNIDQNIAELLRAVKSVISDKNSSTNLNVIAVRA